MSSMVKFTETVFRDRNKKGVLPEPDKDGYYTLLIGGLNCYNSVGEYYVAHNAINLFNESSAFKKRINNGCLYAELGHPRKHPGMTYTEYYSRMIDIQETNLCGHFADVWLDMNYGRNNPEVNNPDMIGIFARVRPHGPHAETLRASLTTPQQNTAFSIRGITENKERNGRVERELTSIITFDHVVMPGITQACKAYAPGLESAKLMVETGDDSIIQVDLFKQVLSETVKHSQFASESSRMMVAELSGHQMFRTPASLPRW